MELYFNNKQFCTNCLAGENISFASGLKNCSTDLVKERNGLSITLSEIEYLFHAKTKRTNENFRRRYPWERNRSIPNLPFPPNLFHSKCLSGYHKKRGRKKWPDLFYHAAEIGRARKQSRAFFFPGVHRKRFSRVSWQSRCPTAITKSAKQTKRFRAQVAFLFSCSSLFFLRPRRPPSPCSPSGSSRGERDLKRPKSCRESAPENRDTW